MSDRVNLLTFMYFIHTASDNNNDMSITNFYNEWSYVMDDFYDLEGESIEDSI